MRVVKLAAVCRHAATPGVGAESQSDGPEGRWILAGGNAPGFVAAARCAPAGAMERRIASPALSTGGGERLPCRAPFPPVDNAAGCATLGCGSGTLPGCLASMGCFRGYRCAQPPANFQQPCRADRGVVAAFGRKPQSCIPMRVVKLAAVFYQEDGDLWTARNTMYAISQNTAPVRNHCRRSFAFLSHPCRV